MTSVNDFQDLSIQDKSEMRSGAEILQVESENHGGICAICLDKIVLQETALVRGCEHAYCLRSSPCSSVSQICVEFVQIRLQACSLTDPLSVVILYLLAYMNVCLLFYSVTCILRWATYRPKATCPQCKHPFEFLNVHRSLDGRLHDYMFEESVCLLLRASWFKPLNVEDHAEHEEVYMYDEFEDYYYEYEGDEDDLDEAYYGGSSSIRIGNRRWGDNGYVRSGRQQARPVYKPDSQNSGASSSSGTKNKEVAKGATTGRRAKRAQKREAADKAAAAKHQQHLVRLGRK